MPEPDPFASPFHHVRLPGEPEPTTAGYGYGHPGPMPADPYAGADPYAVDPYAGANPYAVPSYAIPVAHPYVAAGAVQVKVLERPVALLVASWSWLVGAALVVIGLPGVFFVSSDAHATELYEESRADLDPMSRGEAEIVAMLTPLVFAVAFAVLSVPYVVAAIKLRGGRNWPRVVLAVLGAVAVVFGLFMLALFAGGAVHYLNWLVGTVWALLLLAAVSLGTVAMFVPPANAFVRAVSAR